MAKTSRRGGTPNRSWQGRAFHETVPPGDTTLYKFQVDAETQVDEDSTLIRAIGNLQANCFAENAVDDVQFGMGLLVLPQQVILDGAGGVPSPYEIPSAGSYGWPWLWIRVSNLYTTVGQFPAYNGSGIVQSPASLSNGNVSSVDRFEFDVSGMRKMDSGRQDRLCLVVTNSSSSSTDLQFSGLIRYLIQV